MLSPYDIEVKKFEKSFRGYNLNEVDEFMQMVLNDYEKLYKENSALKSKMAVLVEKIEEYKKIEESLRNAVVSAQKMGETMVKDATTKSELLLRETNLKAERIINNINMQIYREKQRLEDARRENQLFSNKLISMYQAQISLLRSYAENGRTPDQIKLDEPMQRPSRQEIKAAEEKIKEEKKEFVYKQSINNENKTINEKEGNIDLSESEPLLQF
jgi:cell division initiation protein